MVLAAGWLSMSAAHAQTAANLIVVSGNGQAVCPLCTFGNSFFYQPLTVEATDVNGNPVPGVTINWNIASGIGTFFQSGLSTFSNVTDSNGLAQATYQLFNPQAGSPLISIAPAAITASTSTGNLIATFYATQALQDQLPGSPQPLTASVKNNSLLLGESFNGQVGSTAQTPIQIQVADQSGAPVPNVGVFLVDALINSGNPTIACASTPGVGQGVVLTDSNGTATCTPVFGGSPGTGLFWVDIGGAQAAGSPTFPASEFLTFPLGPYNPSTGTGTGYAFSVTPGNPGSTTVVSGNAQSANPGQTLPQPLVAQVNNASNQPLAGIPVTWTVSPTGAASLASSTTTGANGQTSNSVTLSSSASGTVVITATAAGSNSKALFTINVTPLVTITSFQIVSGNNQSAVVGTAFAQPLVVQVSTSNGTPSGVNVQFQVQAGPITLSSTVAVTNGSGQAQVSVQAGAVPGSATVLASVSSAGGGSTQTFNLNVIPQGPSISAANFYNAADLQPNSLSPCGLGMLIASGSLGIPNLGTVFPALPVAPPNSATVSISFNSIQAPILNIGNNAAGQQFIEFQVPCQLSPASSVPVVVNIAGATANVNLNVQAAAPGLFHTVMSDGVARAVVVRPDGTFVSIQNPARRGETAVAYVTGLGATSPPVGTSSLPVPGGTPSAVLGTVIPGLNGAGLPLVYAQLSEDLPGVYVVAFQIPATVAQGNNIPFSIGIVPVTGGAVYSAPTTIPIQ